MLFESSFACVKVFDKEVSEDWDSELSLIARVPDALGVLDMRRVGGSSGDTDSSCSLITSLK